MIYDNTKVPTPVFRAAIKSSHKQYDKVRHHHGKFDVEDLMQECYMKIHMANLWDSKEISLLCTVCERACLDYFRRNIKGYRKKDKEAYSLIRYTENTDGIYEPPDYDLLITFFTYMKRIIHQKTKRRIYIILRNHLLGIVDTITAKRLGITASRIYQLRQEALQYIERI